MKYWHIHSAWIIGILLAVLVGTLAVNWVAIARLPELISFAVGLSSLILAVIAIFQSLASTGSVEASLAAVREAAAGSTVIANDLAGSAAASQQAANDAQAAAAAALTATQELASVSTSILESNEQNRTAIIEMQQDLQAKQSSTAPIPADGEQAPKEAGGKPTLKRLSMGGAAALYAVIRGLETGKSFVLSEVLPEESDLQYEEGYLSALSNAGLIQFDEEEDVLTTREINLDTAGIKRRARAGRYATKSTRDRHKRRIASVDAYFDPPLSPEMPAAGSEE